ncbi:FMN-linked oxidoreductase [Glarea lozoyensis ATCC 20868]|uniref:FMN-linked oxidoreductase n=1 Tax=Glarea lozoyensis (strain ATCC 20868 / MF5171) TaxID=1116229 RepID=S3CJR0_GLAL2|nr:FMN-linked oxidoreductase [Glarea lozoyensis ATCC 20868]EPE26747.1 FMN-linked oxidoreductase [Glarea lozoyensis ATCC 20868]
MLLSQELVLPSGLRLPNRMSKAAMAEGLAATTHDPNQKIRKAYREWAKGGWGMILTGNVQVSDDYLGAPQDIDVPAQNTDELQAAWREWATECQASGTPTIVQLNHPGRQSPAGAGKKSFFTKNLAPSPIGLNFGPGILAKVASKVLFGTPKEMTVQDIKLVIDQFVEGAKRSYDAGFKGVELHAAHGYLLAQFHSPATNRRTDEFGGSAHKRVEISLRIIRRIRAVTSPNFSISIKFNSADAATDKTEDVLEQIRLLVDAGIDFLEISGGTYENPLMMGDDGVAKQDMSEDKPMKASTIKRESFFLEFAQTVRKSFPGLVLMVTGGFRTRTGMEGALQSGACDIVGVGRPAAVYPDFPTKIILNENVKDEDANANLPRIEVEGAEKWIVKISGVTALGAGKTTRVYQEHIGSMAAIKA